MQKLSMWHRIGIVVSVLWIIGSSLLTWIVATNHAGGLLDAVQGLCISSAEGLPNYSAAIDKCQKQGVEVFNSAMEGIWASLAIVSIVPVVLGWCFVYISVRITKWVLAGRQISK